MMRSHWDQRFEKAVHLAKLAKAEAVALPCRAYSFANAAGDPSGHVGMQLFISGPCFDMLAFMRRDVVIEGSVPPSHYEGSVDNDAANGDFYPSPTVKKASTTARPRRILHGGGGALC